MTKNTKVVVKLLTIVAIIAIVSCLVLVGCDKIEDLKDLGKPAPSEVPANTDDNSGDSGDETPAKAFGITVVLIGEGDPLTLETRTNSQYLVGVLDELQTEGRLTYSASNGFVNTIGSLYTTGDYSKWIAMYHDINEDTLIAPGYDMTYNNKTFYSANYGINDLPIRDGATYLFVQQ